MKSSYYQYVAGERIDGRFWAHSQIGKGSYGTVKLNLIKVIKAYNYKEGIDVAIKFLKSGNNFRKVGINETEIIDLITKYNTNKRYSISNIILTQVTYLSTFDWHDHFCIVFPLYNYNLYYSIKKAIESGGYPLSTVRNISKQLLECVHFLQHPNICVIHTDIKPDNILFVNAKSNRIKLIDFGSSLQNPPVKKAHILQTVYYRSPEMIMDLPFSYEIDMWSVGCVLMELRTGRVLFEEKSDSKILNSIVEVCGMPPREMIESSRYSDIWFHFDEGKIKLKTNLTKIYIPGSRPLRNILKKFIENESDRNFKDENHFYDLIKRILVYDPKKRLQPIEALRHPFINSSEDYEYYTEEIIPSTKEEIGIFGNNKTISENNLSLKMSNLNLILDDDSNYDYQQLHSSKKYSGSVNIEKSIQNNSKFSIEKSRLKPIYGKFLFNSEPD